MQAPISSFVPADEESEAVTLHAKQPIADVPQIVANAAPAPQYESGSKKQPANLEVAEPAMQEVTVPTLSPNVQTIAEVTPANTESSSKPSIKAQGLPALQQQCTSCQTCALSKSRSHVVFGEGNASASVVFIGDAPDRDEDAQGAPAVGRSGALFTRMLAAIGLDREQVYMMHAVKCRPLHSRDPKPEEFSACEDWFSAQLDIIQPRLICLLGRVAAQALLKTESPLSEMRAATSYSYHGIPVVVLDHASYLLRSQQHKARAWQDLLRLQSTLNQLKHA